MKSRHGVALAVGLLLLALPSAAAAQIFIASRPNPRFTIGPFTLRATIRPELGPVQVDVVWSLVIPPDQSGAEIEQDLALLWPGAVSGDAGLGAPDPSLVEWAQARGFDVVDQGRVELRARNAFQPANASRERVSAGAPFVTFRRANGAQEASGPATYIRIPWTPALANPTWRFTLRLTIDDLIHRRRATWIEEAFWGRRHRIALSFGEVRARAMFPVYFELRDRVVRLSEDPAQIVAVFRDMEHLKIDEVSPPTANRQASEFRADSETVSLFLDRSEKITPQVLKVQFAYFRGIQVWLPVLIPTVFFVLGNLAGPLLAMAARRLGRRLSARIDLGRRAGGAARERGVVLARETVARLLPGTTTYEQVLTLCGRNPEEHESLSEPDRRTLVYRGRRVVPQRRRVFGWLSTVNEWDVEHHEVEIALERSLVRDVQARVRRSRLTHPE